MVLTKDVVHLSISKFRPIEPYQKQEADQQEVGLQETLYSMGMQSAIYIRWMGEEALYTKNNPKTAKQIFIPVKHCNHILARWGWGMKIRLKITLQNADS